MSDWNKYGRDEDERRYGAAGRGPGGLEQDAARGGPGDYDGRRERERRSYAGEADRRASDGPPRGYRDEAPGPAYRAAGAGPQRFDDGHGQGYGPAWNRNEGRETYPQQTYRGGAAEGPPRHGHEGLFGGDEWLERFSDGRDGANVAGHHFQSHGEHRGRGPKNYTRSDDRIHEDVSDRLSDDSWLDASEIEVKVANGEVTLNGLVASREDKRHAEDLADEISGVRHVQNNLRIQQPAASQAQTHAPGTFTPTPGSGSSRTS